MKMRYFIILIIAFVLPLYGCIPYLAGVVATSRANSSQRQDCAESGGEWVEGSSWGWSVGRCLTPKEKADLAQMSPPERCAFLNGTYSNGNCTYTPEQECLNLGGVYYASTGACDLRNTQSTAQTTTQSTTQSSTVTNQPSIEENKNSMSPQECAKLGGIYYASTDACDLRHTEKESKE